MFARILTLNLKPNHVADLKSTLDKQVIPMLRKQEGFRDEITFVSPNGTEGLAISLWDRKENAEKYNRETYPEVQKTFANLVEGTPQVKTYEVANSTFHKIDAFVPA